MIELLLVMTIMVIAIAIAAPLMANFFRGRTLDSEARRLLALTHAGQSRAVSEGVPMRLWVDADKKTYGLEEDPGWVEQDPKKVEFTLDQDLKFEVIQPARLPSRTSAFGNAQASSGATQTRGLPQIHFLPDGSIEDTSLRALRVYDRDGASLWLAQADNRLNYEIRNQFDQMQ